MLSAHLTMQRFEKPFPGLIVEQAFNNDLHEALTLEFQNVLARGLCDDTSPLPQLGFHRRPKAAGGTSQYGNLFVYHAEPKRRALAESFFSRQFFLWVEEQFSIPLMDEVSCAFHYNVANGIGDAVPHTDFTIEAWRSLALRNSLNQCCFDLSRASGKRGKLKIGARAIALIYYLNNDHWSADRGGATLILNSAALSDVGIRVAPLNNRLLAFEISPNSWHCLEKNLASNRSSIITFLYADPKLLEAKFNAPLNSSLHLR